MTTKVALYCRISTSTKDQTTENQLRELKSYCERMDYEIVKVYGDEVSGAKSREKRPAYSELCKDALLKKLGLITVTPRTIIRQNPHATATLAATEYLP